MPTDARIVRIEWAVVEGKRPISLGKNARLPAHGAVVSVPLCRLTTDDGLVGVGPSRVDIDVSYEALGLPVSRMFGEDGTRARWLSLDYALWDLAGRRAGVPVYQLAFDSLSERPRATGTPVVDCYDTSFYFDDLEPLGDEPQRLAERAAASYERGHRAFKVKVGRGARWMGAAEGMDRDVAVIQAVRGALGAECTLLADANNGYTFNGAREFMVRTADSHVGWLEEPFGEDTVLLAALRDWVAHEGLDILLADCESATTEEAYELASSGVLDVVQCDVLEAGFTGWLRLGSALDAVGVASAPHHFGLYLGNYVPGHLASVVKNLRYIEWDQASVPGVSLPGYHFSDGRLRVSDGPGFGIELDEELFAQAVKTSGFDLRITHASI
jgi:L-rhamnonate dehydratase